MLWNITLGYNLGTCIGERAIWSAKNFNVDEINFKIQPTISSIEITFKSIDTVFDPDEVIIYTIQFLNSLDLYGMPPHN